MPELTICDCATTAQEKEEAEKCSKWVTAHSFPYHRWDFIRSNPIPCNFSSKRYSSAGTDCFPISCSAFTKHKLIQTALAHSSVRSITKPGIHSKASTSTLFQITLNQDWPILPFDWGDVIQEMTFDCMCSDLYFDFGYCWVSLQQEPTMLLTSAEIALLSDSLVVLKSCKEMRPCRRVCFQMVEVQSSRTTRNKADTQDSKPTM